jgi:hypothetical protein
MSGRELAARGGGCVRPPLYGTWPLSDLAGDRELAGAGSETLDEYRRRVGGDALANTEALIVAQGVAAALDFTPRTVNADTGRTLWPGEDSR